MKYFKYAFVSILTIFCLPNIVKAEKSKVYTNYKTGDEITVNLSESIQEKVYVIQDNQDSQKVKAIFKATIGEPVAYGFYSGIIVGGVTNTSDYASSTVKKTLEEYAIKQGWTTYEEIRLLNETDMGDISKTEKKLPSWITLDKEYWTSYMLQDVSVEEECTPAGDKQCILRAPDRVAMAISKTGLFQKSINSEAYMRPVIVISKDYIEGGYTEVDVPSDDKPDSSQKPEDDSSTDTSTDTTNPDSIQKPDNMQTGNNSTNQKVENPKTGVHISLGVLFVGMVSAIVYLYMNKKKYFRKI